MGLGSSSWWSKDWTLSQVGCVEKGGLGGKVMRESGTGPCLRLLWSVELVRRCQLKPRYTSCVWVLYRKHQESI